VLLWQEAILNEPIYQVPRPFNIHQAQNSLHGRTDQRGAKIAIEHRVLSASNTPFDLVNPLPNQGNKNTVLNKYSHPKPCKVVATRQHCMKNLPSTGKYLFNNSTENQKPG